MSIFARIRFATDEKGSVMMIFGLCFLILVGIGGAGYDLGHQQLVKQKLQQATDTAALAAAGLQYGSTNAERQTEAQRYYALNFPAGYLGVTTPPTPTITIGTQTVQVSTTDTPIATSFVRNLPGGATSLPAKGDSTAAMRINSVPPIDMILVMDNSSSMALLDVGTGSTMNVPTASITTARNNAMSACYTSMLASGATWYTPQYTSNYNAYYYYYNTTLGYTPAAAATAATTAATAATNNAASTYCTGLKNWDTPTCPYIVMTGCATNYGLTGVSGAVGPNRLNALRFSAETISNALLAPPNTINNRIAIIRWSDVVMENRTLSNNKTIVNGYLDKMFAYGQTNSTPALQAALTTSASMSTTSARSIVLLTDGLNNLPAYNTSSLAICNTLKANGIIIYTIAFGQEVVPPNPNSPAVQSFLSSCASGTAGANTGTYFFIAPDAATLAATFQNILISLQRVRVTQ